VLLAVTGCAAGGGDAVEDTGQPDVAAEIAPAPEDCTGSLVGWKGGFCAPQVDDCPPGRLALVGGGCRIIGPRACPLIWDPEADIDCNPDEPLPCPEGLVETEDGVACIPHFDECEEMEVPLLGGGCKRVGPLWKGRNGEPHFDNCEQYELALPGGGCVQVGPRACPKLWDPDSDAACEVGDLLPCPEGWDEKEDGLYCEPQYDQCKEGQRPLLGGGCERVVPLEVDCPEGPFPEPPEGIENVVYVLAGSACTDGCGTESDPFPDIQSALAAAPGAGAILVGPGDYPGGIELHGSARIHGLCSAKTAIASAGPIPAMAGSSVPVAGIALVNASGARLSGLGFKGDEGAGILVVNSQNYLISDVELAGNFGVGVLVSGASTGEVERAWIHGTDPDAGAGVAGSGLHAEGGAAVTIRNSLVESASGSGILGAHEGTYLAVVDTTVRDTRPAPGYLPGMGCSVYAGATLNALGAVLEGNHVVGLLVDESGGTVNESVIRGTGPAEASKFGMGIRVANAGSLEVVHSLVEDNEVVGAGPWEAGSELSLIRSIVRDTKQGAWLGGGFGLEAKGGSEAEVLGCLIDNNLGNGIYAQMAGTSIEVAGTLVRDTDTEASTDWGQGVATADSARMTVFRSVLEGNSGAGAIARLETESLTLRESTMRENRVDSGGGLGVGVYAGGDSDVTVESCLVERCHDSGIVALQPGANLYVEGSVVRDNKVTDFGMFGDGIRVDYGGSATIFQTVVEGNRHSGVIVLNTGSTAVLDEVVIRGTTVDEHDGMGQGLSAQEAVFVEARNCLIEDNVHDGVVATHNGPLLILEDSVVRNTELWTDEQSGYGIRAALDGRVEARNCLIEGNHNTGVSAQHEGSSLLAENLYVRGTKPNGAGLFGYGMSAVEGALIEATGCLVEGNSTSEVASSWPGTHVDFQRSLIRAEPGDTEGWTTGGRAVDGGLLTFSDSCIERTFLAGITAFHKGTAVELERSVVRWTQPGFTGSSGVGAHLEPGASISVIDSIVEENQYVGMYLYGEGTNGHVLRSVVRGTLPNDSGEHGHGLVVQTSASLSIEGSLVEGNGTTGVAVFHQGSTIAVQDSRVTGTQAGGAIVFRNGREEQQNFGDGILAAQLGHTVVSNSLVDGNSRCGIYVAGSSATVAGNSVVGNNSFGLAMEECADKVNFEGLGNLFAGNGSGLPAVVKAETTDTPKGLPVPPPPSLAGAGNE